MIKKITFYIFYNKNNIIMKIKQIKDKILKKINQKNLIEASKAVIVVFIIIIIFACLYLFFTPFYGIIDKFGGI